MENTLRDVRPLRPDFLDSDMRRATHVQVNFDEFVSFFQFSYLVPLI